VARKALGEQIHPALAAVGDVVLLAQEGRELLAVCNGTEALCAAPTGLAPVPMRQALAAWKV
jgi:hypothetical protein